MMSEEPAMVEITYFKPSGKYYTTDDDVEWPRDASHYTGWAPFERVARISGMIAVCMVAPHGFPQMQVTAAYAEDLGDARKKMKAIIGSQRMELKRLNRAYDSACADRAKLRAELRSSATASSAQAHDPEHCDARIEDYQRTLEAARVGIAAVASLRRDVEEVVSLNKPGTDDIAKGIDRDALAGMLCYLANAIDRGVSSFVDEDLSRNVREARKRARWLREHTETLGAAGTRERNDDPRFSTPGGDPTEPGATPRSGEASQADARTRAEEFVRRFFGVATRSDVEAIETLAKMLDGCATGWRLNEELESLVRRDAARGSRELFLAREAAAAWELLARQRTEQLADLARVIDGMRTGALRILRSAPDCDDAALCEWSRGRGCVCSCARCGAAMQPRELPRTAESAEVPQEVHDRGWQWRPVGDDGAFAPPFGTIRVCECGCLVAGGPTRCTRCANEPCIEDRDDARKENL